VADLLMLGVSAGIFVLPLQAFVQQRSPKAKRGRYIATGNIVSFSAILLASASLWAFSEHFRLHPGQIFLVTSLMTLVAALYIVWMLPDLLLRLVLYPVINLLYRIQPEGEENVPLEGPALLVSNHISYADPLILIATQRRRLRFIMITLAVTPLRRISHWNWLSRFRRMLGLFTFFYAFMHFVTWLVLDREMRLGDIIEDLTERPFITLGFTAFVLLAALAVTSFTAVRRRMGRRWQTLHNMAYAIAILGVWR